MLKHTKENRKRHLGCIHWKSHWKIKLCYCSWCNYCVWCTTGLSSPCLLFLPLSSSPFLSYLNHVFPPGLIKRLSNRGECRKENGGRWQQRRVVLITPCVWKRKGGVEDLFQLINGSLSLFLPDSSIRDNMSGTDIARSQYHDRNTVVLLGAKFHVKPLWSTKRPDSLTSCLIRLIVHRTL